MKKIIVVLIAIMMMAVGAMAQCPPSDDPTSLTCNDPKEADICVNVDVLEYMQLEVIDDCIDAELRCPWGSSVVLDVDGSAECVITANFPAKLTITDVNSDTGMILLSKGADTLKVFSVNVLNWVTPVSLDTPVLVTPGIPNTLYMSIASPEFFTGQPAGLYSGTLLITVTP